MQACKAVLSDSDGMRARSRNILSIAPVVVLMENPGFIIDTTLFSYISHIHEY